VEGVLFPESPYFDAYDYSIQTPKKRDYYCASYILFVAKKV